MQGGHGLSDHGDPRGVAWRMLSPFEISNAVYKHCFYIFLTPPKYTECTADEFAPLKCHLSAHASPEVLRVRR